MKLQLSKSNQINMNLRTRGWGLVPEGDHLVLGAVYNRLQGAKFVGHTRIDNWRNLEDEAIATQIEEFLDDHKLKRAEAFLGIPRNQVVIQMADFPAEAEETLDEVVQYQIENIFPGDFEEFDFFNQVIHRGDQLRVMIVAVRKETLGEYYGFIRRFKIQLAGMTLVTLANANGIARILGESFLTSHNVVLDFSGGGLDFLGIREGKIATSHFVPLPETGWQGPLVQCLEDGLGRTRLAANEVEHYFLIGNPDLEKTAFLSTEIGLPLVIPQDHFQTEIPCEAFSAVGLGLTAVQDNPTFGLNALPANLRKRHRRLPVMIAAVALILLVLWLGVSEVRSYMKLRRELAGVVEVNDKLMVRLQEMGEIKAKHQARQTEVDAYRPFRYSDGFLLKLLANLSRELPLHTFLNSLSIKDGQQITINGESEDPYEVRSHLQSLNIFTKVEFSGPVSPSRDKKKKKFTLIATIQLEALR
ncbi:MAG: hypothetical protein H6510_14000 [Acidobacteria bacterium]|nr:hypothetical protein [Acidobacteriota bacterium]MCB9398921.1 hypothetical protein [Acidobacteriota bacterium]